MFESIKTAITRNEKPNNRKDYLRTEVGNTYTVRLLPYVKNPEKTFFHYYAFGWTSLSTGQNITVISPSTWQQRDPIVEERFRVYRSGTDQEKEKIKLLRRSENWLVNAYVVNDPVTPDNNGKVKIIRYGRQLNKVIDRAINGDEAEDIGPRMFDLSEVGTSLSIVVEQQGDFPTYVSSKFKLPKAIDGLKVEDFEKVYNSVFDLEATVSAKSYDEIKATLDQHYHCVNGVTASKNSTPASSVVAVPTQEHASNTEAAMNDAEIDNLLKNLDS